MTTPTRAAAGGEPCQDRTETIAQIAALNTRSELCNVFGDGPMLVSDIPQELLNGTKKAVMGIDEAGRGPVLGPMVYGSAFWAVDSDDVMSKKGFDDSKALTHATRSKIFDKILATNDLGFTVRILHASEISRNMLHAVEPYNLNAMSHDAAIAMIRTVLNAGVKLERVYIDTVGIPQSYQAKLDRIFQGLGIQFTVEKKADSKYASCSAASICAKVIRDDLTANWKWSEPHFEPAMDESKSKCEDSADDDVEQKPKQVIGFGSGYPSDPKCKAWMAKNFSDRVFGFPDFCRFSWGPAKNAAMDRGALVEWEADEDEDPNADDGEQATMSDFFSSGGRKKKRLKLFQDLGIQEARPFVF